MAWRLIAAVVVLGLVTTAAAQDQIPLWEKGAPGFEDRKDVAEIRETFYIRNVHQPSITAFLPAADKANGAAMLICPGGAHRFLTIDSEGTGPAKYMADRGVAAFVLKYRLGRDDKSPLPVYEIEKHARQDAHRAIRLIRSRAAEWKIDTARIGIMGFSAGGEVVSLSAFPAADKDLSVADQSAADPVDRQNGKPNFLVYVYPGPVGIPEAVPKDAPPAFLCVAADDRGASRSIDRLYQKYRENGALVESHIFAQGGHAFGFGGRSKFDAVKHWPDRLMDWMADRGILKAKEAAQ